MTPGEGGNMPEQNADMGEEDDAGIGRTKVACAH